MKWVQTSKTMISRGEEEVMLDLAKGNLWLLLIMQEVHEKIINVPRGKEVFRTLRN